MKNYQTFLMTFLSTLILFSTGNLFAEKTLYDDFSTGYLDGEKWKQRTYVREIVDGQYISKLGNRSPGMGAEIAPGIFRNHLPFVNPDSISSIECEITVEEAILDNATDSKSGTMILGYFYNINESSGATGDIFAYLMIGKRENEGEDLEAFWAVLEVLTDDTQTKRLLGSGTISGFDPSIINPPYKAKISYDDDRTFYFNVGQYSDSFIGPEKKRTADTQLKSLSTGIDAMSGSNNGFVFAKFGNVYINDENTVYDDFSSPLIDLTKWTWSEWVREASNGYLRANIIGNGSTRTVNTHLTEKDATYFEAKVRIDSGSQLSAGADGIGRIQGYYYNDSRGPGSGQDYNQYEGDVFVQVLLRYNSDAILSAEAYVHRSNDENESSFTELFSHNFSVPIYLDTYYTLSIRFEGEKLIFGCASETAEYNITTPIYPAYGEHRHLKSRVFLDLGETGYIKVRFDDVYIAESIDFCRGDFEPDGDVDGSDLAVFAADFGRTDCSNDCEGDFNSDGDVDGSDLAIFAADFGRTDCP
jgi:hypothetical protein